MRPRSKDSRAARTRTRTAGATVGSARWRIAASSRRTNARTAGRGTSIEPNLRRIRSTEGIARSEELSAAAPFALFTDFKIDMRGQAGNRQPGNAQFKKKNEPRMDAEFERPMRWMYHGRLARALCFKIESTAISVLPRHRHGRDARDTLKPFFPYSIPYCIRPQCYRGSTSNELTLRIIRRLALRLECASVPQCLRGCFLWLAAESEEGGRLSPSALCFHRFRVLPRFTATRGRGTRALGFCWRPRCW